MVKIIDKLKKAWTYKRTNKKEKLKTEIDEKQELNVESKNNNNSELQISTEQDNETLKKEKQKHFEAFRYFFTLIEKGHNTTKSIDLTAEAFGVKPRTVWRWYKSFNWGEKSDEKIREISNELEKKEINTIIENKLINVLSEKEEYEKKFELLEQENRILKQDNKLLKNGINEIIKRLDGINTNAPSTIGEQKQNDKNNEDIQIIETEKVSIEPSTKHTTKIYDPLPEKYYHYNLKSNSTGIAYVSQYNSQYRYKHDNFVFTSNNIYKIFKKVVANNLLWGIIDYEKASKIIDIPEDILSKHIQKESKILKIYDPLPEEDMHRFRKFEDEESDNYWDNLIEDKNKKILKNIFIKNGVLYATKSRKAQFQLKTIKYIKDNLNKFKENEYNLHAIYDELKENELFFKPFATQQIQRYLYNIIKGTFDEFLKDFEEDNIDTQSIESKTELNNNDWRDYHPFFKSFSIPEAYQWEFGDTKLVNVGINTIDMPGNYGFNLFDVLYLINNLNYYNENNYNIEDIIEDIKLPKNTIYRLLYSIAKGIFEKPISNYNSSHFKDEFNKYLSKKNSEKINNYLIDSFPKLCKVYDEDFILKGNEAVSTKSPDLAFVMEDIIYVKDHLNEFILDKKYSLDEIISEVDSVLDYTKVNKNKFGNMIYSLNNGAFNNLIDEYADDFVFIDKAVLTTVEGKLFVDDNDTGLTVSECNIILYDYDNAANKQICLHNKIRYYDNVDAKYIWLVCSRYDDSVFRKALKSDDDKIIPPVNNPQKRRENQMY